MKRELVDGNFLYAINDWNRLYCDFIFQYFVNNAQSNVLEVEINEFQYVMEIHFLRKCYLKG